MYHLEDLVNDGAFPTYHRYISFWDDNVSTRGEYPIYDDLYDNNDTDNRGIVGDDDDGGDGGRSYESYHSSPINIHEYGFPARVRPADKNYSHIANHDDDWEGSNGSTKDVATSNSFVSRPPAELGCASVGVGGDCSTIHEEGDSSTHLNDDERLRHNSSIATSTNAGGVRSPARHQQSLRQYKDKDDYNFANTIDDGLGWEEISSSLVVDWKNVSSPQSPQRNKSRVKFSAPESTETAMITPISTTVDKSSKIDPFAWYDDRDYRGKIGQGDAKVPSQFLASQWKLRNELAKERQRKMLPFQRNNKQLVESTSVNRELTQPSLSRRMGGEVLRNSFSQQRPILDEPSRDARSRDPIVSHKTTLVSFSDGEVSDMGYDPRSRSTLRRRMGLFRSKSPRYQSEGERSDSDWESSGNEGRSKAERGRKRTKKYPALKQLGNLSQSPLRMKLFGQRNHHVDANVTLEANVALLKDGEVAELKSSPMKAGTDKSGVDDNSGKLVHIIALDPKNEGPKHQTATGMITEHIDTMNQESSSHVLLSDFFIEEEQHLHLETDLNESRETQETSNLSSKSLSVRRNKEPQSFLRSDSTVTQKTSILSNKSIGKSSVLHVKEPQSMLNTARPPPATTSTNRVTHRNRPEHLGLAYANIVTNVKSKDNVLTIDKSNFDAADDVLSLSGSKDSEALGSLVTARSQRARKSKPATYHTSPASVATELSEIDRLRKENDRLREELENASQLSSKVSHMYAENLKRENDRLRVTKEILYKSTLINTILEEGSTRRSRKSRVRHPPSAQAMTEFNQLLPVAHLINGVDFDDDSITTYSTLAGGRTDPVGVESQQNLLMKTCTRIATTTAGVASHVKTALNQENQESSCSIPISRPMDCFNQCSSARRRMTSKSADTKTSKTRRKPSSTRRNAAPISLNGLPRQSHSIPPSSLPWRNSSPM
jgi:hypothetical protein